MNIWWQYVVFYCWLAIMFFATIAVIKKFKRSSFAVFLLASGLGPWLFGLGVFTEPIWLRILMGMVGLLVYVWAGLIANGLQLFRQLYNQPHQ